MAAAIVLALVVVVSFLGLARAAIDMPGDAFRRMTSAMAAVAILIAVLEPTAGLALLGPVLLSRRLANAPLPETVEELLERYEVR